MRNVIDSIYEYVNPNKALSREVARLRLGMAKNISNSGYDESGASKRKHSMRGWKADSRSPQKDIDINLNTLRKRSRSLYMSAPLATSAIKTNRTNVVGSGLILKPVIDYNYLGMSHEEADELKKSIIREWKIWAESKFCDNNRQNDFYELQQIALISWLMNGDGLGLLRYSSEKRSYMPYQLRIKLIENDKLTSPKQATEDYVDMNLKAENGNRIINGIEIDEHGQVIAYWISNNYLSDYDSMTKNDWTRIEAYGEKTGNPNVIHVFDAERCEQYRGVPFLAPVIETIKQLTRYTDAEIMAAVINGMFTVFVKTVDGGDNIDFEGVSDEEEETDNSQEDDNNLQLGNGLINYLKPGESIEVADSKRPNSNFDGFVSSLTKYIGAALEIPPELLLKSFTASYSASRGALLEAWKGFRMRRVWFANDFCKPIYEVWFSEAVSKGRIKAPGFFDDPLVKKAYCGSEWVGPAPGQLDPVKEVNAAVTRMNNGLSTHETEAAEINGTNFDNNVEQLKIENQKLSDTKVKEDSNEEN
ncbi:phage portal protein [Lachnospiraceae bacterium KM106-2]|nr:phage portal protein [Lachnospiraceae bacterium KM106-2]